MYYTTLYLSSFPTVLYDITSFPTVSYSTENCLCSTLYYTALHIYFLPYCTIQHYILPSPLYILPFFNIKPFLLYSTIERCTPSSFSSVIYSTAHILPSLFYYKSLHISFISYCTIHHCSFFPIPTVQYSPTSFLPSSAASPGHGAAPTRQMGLILYNTALYRKLLYINTHSITRHYTIHC